jgi:hypothetical protein
MVTTLGSSRLSVSCVLAFGLVLSWAGLLAPVPAMAEEVKVTSAFPTAAPQATYGLNVSIKGSGFKRGAAAAFYVTNTTDPGGVKVNSTTFKSSTELVANIDVAAGATLSKFDIKVMSGGRTGKGTELFSVVEKGTKCYTSPLPTDWSLVDTLNDPSDPEFSGEFGRAIAVDRYGTDAVVVAVGSRISGRVEVFLLDLAGHPWHHVSLTLASGSESLRLAQGDVNGDSLPDIVVGQEFLQSASLFLAEMQNGTLGYGSAIPLTPPPGEDKAGFGTSVAIGDVDGDSIGEVVVGAPNAKVGSVTAAGKVFVFESSGAFQRLVTRPVPKKSDYFGVSVAVGNVVGDLHADLIVGARGVDVGTSTDAGKVFAFPGPLGYGGSPVELTRSVKGEGLGYRSTVGNVDADAYGDVVTVGYLKPPAVVFTGEVWSGQAADFVLQPQAGLDLGFGTNIAAGDINGDYRDDVFVATPNATDNFGTCANTGAAYVYVSDTGSLSNRVLLQPPDAAAGLYGWAVAAAPGPDLLLVGEPLRTLGTVNRAGQVYVYLAP